VPNHRVPKIVGGSFLHLLKHDARQYLEYLIAGIVLPDCIWRLMASEQMLIHKYRLPEKEIQDQIEHYAQ